MAPHNPNALAEAQSASEMFDVMCPPIAGFDIYNDRAVPTGESKARGTVHAQKQWHRSVHVWLVDAERGLVALQKRSPNKDTFPNRWDISAAGHIESGDESRPTAVRELAEELGVTCLEDDLEFLGCVPAIPNYRKSNHLGTNMEANMAQTKTTENQTTMEPIWKRTWLKNQSQHRSFL